MIQRIVPGALKPLSCLVCVGGLVLLFILNSCKKVEVDLGTDFVDNSTTNLVLVDSSTLEISTVYVDSFITSASGSMLVGRYKDPAFGDINAASFVQIGVPATTTTIPNGATFDSLEIVLKTNNTFYGDTSVPYSISVHQLTEAIVPPGEQISFYNINTTGYNNTPLGTSRRLVHPAAGDSVAVRLSASLGQDLFDKLVSSDAIVTSNDFFIDYFKGLALVDGGGNSLVMGFKDSMVMRLHYRNPGVITTDAYVEFPMSNNTRQYNHIASDRAGTPIANLGPSNREILSGDAKNAGYSQYISGAMAKVRFPYLRNLHELPNFVKLIKADLIIKPVKGSFTDFLTLPPQVRLSQTDQYNAPGVDIAAYSAATASTATLYGDLYIDQLYGTQTAYTYDITTYLQAQILNTDINKNGLLLLPPDQTKTFDRLVLGDKFNKESQSLVKIYYATVK